MAIAIGNTFAADEPTRRPGDFYRSKNGTPYVSDPSGALAPYKGNKPELLALCADRGIDVPAKVTVAQLHKLLGQRPKQLPYGRPSSFGKQIESTYNLQKWSERQVALAFGLDPTLVERAGQLVVEDRETKEWKDAADGVVVEAKRLARSGIAAERGTHAHALAEDDDEGRDIVARIEAGEELGLEESVQRAIVSAWREMLEREGLEILANEQAVVHDGYRMAGTTDRVARLLRAKRFSMITGEIVELPAGIVVDLDIKSGKRRLDPKGVVMYWQSYAVQIAVYAGGVPYDTETDTRGGWPFEIDQHWALIAHLDVLGAIDGKPSCELVLVDIEAGRMAADLCMAARAWESRLDVFSIAQLEAAAQEVEEVAPGVTTPPAASSTPNSPAVEGPLQTAATAGDGDAPTAAPANLAPGQDPASPARADPERLALVDARARLTSQPDQGADLSGAEFGEGWATLQRHYNDLDAAARSWLAGLISEATKRGVSFHARHMRSLRVYELYRGLISLCAAEGDQDELLRALVALVIGDVALFPGIHIGHALGSMHAHEATAFAEFVDQFNGPGLAGFIDDDGLFRLRAA